MSKRTAGGRASSASSHVGQHPHPRVCFLATCAVLAKEDSRCILLYASQVLADLVWGKVGVRVVVGGRPPCRKYTRGHPLDRGNLVGCSPVRFTSTNSSTSEAQLRGSVVRLSS
ncbi:hypothetical protein BDZ89DRAFT_1070088 [Hymenopellis radicata]|nr:hypothetical protein BDZ89DRAFT_1070088 [Hymenopellis radicata]